MSDVRPRQNVCGAAMDRRRCGGVTLVELLVALSLSVVVGAVAWGMLRNAAVHGRSRERRIGMLVSVLAASEAIGRELATAVVPRRLRREPVRVLSGGTELEYYASIDDPDREHAYGETRRIRLVPLAGGGGRGVLECGGRKIGDAVLDGLRFSLHTRKEGGAELHFVAVEMETSSLSGERLAVTRLFCLDEPSLMNDAPRRTGGVRGGEER